MTDAAMDKSSRAVATIEISLGKLQQLSIRLIHFRFRTRSQYIVSWAEEIALRAASSARSSAARVSSSSVRQSSLLYLDKDRRSVASRRPSFLFRDLRGRPWRRPRYPARGRGGPPCTRPSNLNNSLTINFDAMLSCALWRKSPPASIDAQFTKSYSLTTALAPFTLRVWLTICLWAALLV
jgi:hypothetical protein